MVPVFTLLLGMEQKSAVASSLAVVVVTALMGTLNHVVKKSDLIDWRLVAFTAIGAAVAAWFGTDLMRSMSNQALTKSFGVILLVVGIRMIILK